MTRSQDLARVRAEGKRSKGSAVELRIVDVGMAPRRVGVIVPLHGHTAVERNRVKRRLREIVRTQGMLSSPAGAFVVFALPSAYRSSFEELRIELAEMCQRALR